jgi:hypothetical protein
VALPPFANAFSVTVPSLQAAQVCRNPGTDVLSLLLANSEGVRVVALPPFANAFSVTVPSLLVPRVEATLGCN